jgi:branched-chain amino acid transport system ATP-binding protein
MRKRREITSWEVWELLDLATLAQSNLQSLTYVLRFMTCPKLLMIDEISPGLAPRIVQQMFEIGRQILDWGITVLLVEQQMKRALQCAYSAYILENGATALSGKTGELLNHDHVKRVYLGM